MKGIEIIQEQLGAGEFQLTQHALRRMVERNISAIEIVEAGVSSEIIEEYPEDKYSPSALLLGFTATGRPIHLQVSLVESERTRIITMYEPESEEWFEFRIRR